MGSDLHEFMQQSRFWRRSKPSGVVSYCKFICKYQYRISNETAVIATFQV